MAAEEISGRRNFTAFYTVLSYRDFIPFRPYETRRLNLGVNIEAHEPVIICVASGTLSTTLNLSPLRVPFQCFKPHNYYSTLAPVSHTPTVEVTNISNEVIHPDRHHLTVYVFAFAIPLFQFNPLHIYRDTGSERDHSSIRQVRENIHPWQTHDTQLITVDEDSIVRNGDCWTVVLHARNLQWTATGSGVRLNGANATRKTLRTEIYFELPKSIPIQRVNTVTPQLITASNTTIYSVHHRTRTRQLRIVLQRLPAISSDRVKRISLLTLYLDFSIRSEEIVSRLNLPPNLLSLPRGDLQLLSYYELPVRPTKMTMDQGFYGTYAHALYVPYAVQGIEQNAMEVWEPQENLHISYKPVPYQTRSSNLTIPDLVGLGRIFFTRFDIRVPPKPQLDIVLQLVNSIPVPSVSVDAHRVQNLVANLRIRGIPNRFPMNRGAPDDILGHRYGLPEPGPDDDQQYGFGPAHGTTGEAALAPWTPPQPERSEDEDFNDLYDGSQSLYNPRYLTGVRYNRELALLFPQAKKSLKMHLFRPLRISVQTQLTPHHDIAHSRPNHCRRLYFNAEDTNSLLQATLYTEALNLPTSIITEDDDQMDY